MSGFRNSSFQGTRYKRVQLTLYSQYGSREFEIEALEVPEISKDLPRLTEQTILQELDAKAMPFADFSFEAQPEPGISLLIGADFYWKLVTGVIRRLSKNLTAVKTVFGWMVHGGATSISPIVDFNEIRSMHVATKVPANEQKKTISELDHLGVTAERELSEESTENFKAFQHDEDIDNPGGESASTSENANLCCVSAEIDFCRSHIRLA